MGPKVLVWTTTTVVSLDEALFEVGSIGAPSTISLGFLATRIGVDSATFGASTVTTIGLDTNFLGLVFSASAPAFILATTLHLTFTSAFLFVSYSSQIFQVASYFALSSCCNPLRCWTLALSFFILVFLMLKT